jgi:hypothetical protein
MDRKKIFQMKNRKQSGAVAIEFALIFPVFLALIYTLICYSLAFLLVQSLTYTAEDALRSALTMKCPGGCAEEDLAQLARDHVADTLTWLPASKVTAAAAGEDFFVCTADMLCTVRLATSPLIDGITLPIIGKVPDIPSELIARASLRL